MDTKRISLLLLSVIVAFIVYFLPLPLEPAAKIVLSVMFFGMILWVSETIPGPP